MLVVGVLLVNLTSGVRVFPPSRLGKVSTFLTIATGATALALNAIGECPAAVHWLYVSTLVVLVASTAQYVYLASERNPRRS
jgi:phosphatidylglycerophosphate synthase